MRHTISVLVNNDFGVLSRVSGLFSGRGFNIDSLCVAETGEPGVSRMTIVSTGDEQIIEQITKQLNKLVNVIKVHDFTGEEYLKRELALVKVSSNPENKAAILSTVDIFRATVVDVSSKSYTIEITGSVQKVQAMIDLMIPFGVKDIVRTGPIAMARGQKSKTGPKR